MFPVAAGPILPSCASQTQLTNRLNRTVDRAGMQRWVKPWMNLRSSVETHLVREGFDLTTVTTWLGNSPDVARKHYLQVTLADIAKATDEKFSDSFQTGSAPVSKTGKNAVFVSAETRGNAEKYTRQDSNLQPSVPKTDILSS